MKGPIQSLEVSYIVHATEDGDKIEKAVAGLFRFQDRGEVDRLEGHFGNEIIRVSHHVTGENAEAAFSALVAKMPQRLKEQLKDEMGQHLDEHSAFYVRLDKQRLLAGEPALAGSDPVRVRVKPRLITLKVTAVSLFGGLLS